MSVGNVEEGILVDTSEEEGDFSAEEEEMISPSTSSSGKKKRLRRQREERDGPACPHCQKMYTRTANLNLHIRSHTGEKPFVCEQCHKGFTQKSNLYVFFSFF
jgi:uncharacterized Zn-finger protein